MKSATVVLATILLSSCAPGEHLIVVHKGALAIPTLGPTRQDCAQYGESVGCPRTSDGSQCAPDDGICINRRASEADIQRQADDARKLETQEADRIQKEELRKRQIAEEIALYARPVDAPDWYILNNKEVECYRAIDMAKANGRPALRSPDTWQNAERDAGVFVSTKVDRDIDGKIAMAEVISIYSPVYFFSTKQHCEDTRLLNIQNGTLTRPSELK